MSRICYDVIQTDKTEDGWLVALVTEYEPGYAPLNFRWNGETFEEVRKLCDEVNLTKFGLSVEDTLTIVVSAMRAQNLRRGVEDETE